MSELCKSLEAEHRVIERVLDALEEKIARFQSGAPVDTEFFKQALAFAREFADGLHHQKEEQILFPAMVESGIPQDEGPIGVMLDEHEEGRRCIRRMAESLEAAAMAEATALEALADAGREYVTLLRAHIQKEDGVLFPMADRMVGESRQAAVRSAFAEAEAQHADRAEAHGQWVTNLSGL